MLSRNLQAVIAQSLVPRNDRTGRIAVHEILIGTPRVRQMIADGQTDMTLAIEAERTAGMQTMDDALIKLYEKGEISRETAQSRLTDKSRLPAPESGSYVS
jgi:Tfp pilus assembly pilus retraction ATPase PilT